MSKFTRNYNHLLNEQEQGKWRNYCENKLNFGGKGVLSLTEYVQRLETLAHEHQQDSHKMAIKLKKEPTFTSSKRCTKEEYLSRNTDLSR